MTLLSRNFISHLTNDIRGARHFWSRVCKESATSKLGRRFCTARCRSLLTKTNHRMETIYFSTQSRKRHLVAASPPPFLFSIATLLSPLILSLVFLNLAWWLAHSSPLFKERNYFSKCYHVYKLFSLIPLKPHVTDSVYLY